MAQRQITSAFKLGRECYLNNSFRGPVPSREREREGCGGKGSEGDRAWTRRECVATQNQQ